MKFVIGHDGSDRGADALALGLELADVVGASVVLTRILTWPTNLMGPHDLDAAAEAETAEFFAAVRRENEGAAMDARPWVNRSPAAGLYEIAAAEGATMIVVGSSHRGAIGRVLPGSVGASLLHGAPCAVSIAPAGFAEEQRSLHRIGVGFDGSAESWTALETAIGLAERVRAQLFVFTVTEFHQYGYGAALAILTAQEYESREHAEKRGLLERAMGRIPEELAAESVLLTGEAASALGEAAQSLDLMVLGSRGYGPLGRVLLGSTSRRFADSAPCAMLVLPRGAGMDPLGLSRQSTSASTTAK